MKRFLKPTLKIAYTKKWLFFFATFVLPPLSCTAQSITGPDNICAGSTATFRGPDGFRTYRWSTNDSTQSITVTTSGTYSLTITDAQNTAQTLSKTLIVNALPQPAIQGVPYVCNQNAATLYITDIYPSVIWSNGSNLNQITIAQPSTVSVTVTDALGCVGSASLTIRDGSQSYNALPDTVKICEGDSIELDATVLDAVLPTDFRYVWLPVDSTSAKLWIHSRDTGYFNVLAIGRCVSYDTVYIVSLPRPVLLLPNPDTAICKGETFILKPTLTEGYQYLWSNGSTSATLPIKNSGTYAVTVSYGSCRDSATTNIFYFNERTETNVDTISCDTAMRLIPLSNRFVKSIFWSDGSRDSTLTVYKSGLFTADLSNGRCAIRWRFTTHFKVKPFFDLGKDTIICTDYGKPATFLNAKQKIPATYRWQDDSEKPTLQAMESGLYFAEVTNECGTFSDSILITFKECFPVFVPNVFYPQSETATHQVVRVYPGPAVKSIKSFRIYNRWGNIVFAAQNFEAENIEKFAWDGRVNNRLMTPDVYVYVVEYFNNKGEYLVKSGDVTLMR